MVRSRSIALSFPLLCLAVACSAPRAERVRDIEGFHLPTPVAAERPVASSSAPTAEALPWVATGPAVSEVEGATKTALSFSSAPASAASPEEVASWQDFQDTDRAGFLYGEQHFRNKPRPLDQPFYFESPFVNTEVRPIFLFQRIPEEASALLGDAHIFTAAVQARVAVTEELQVMVTKNGVSWMKSDLGRMDGWNDAAFGLKYAFLTDPDNNLMAAGGLRYEMNNGSRDVFQGAGDELSIFATVYKALNDRTNLIADINGRLPLDAIENGDGNAIVSWDVHLDFEVATGFFPLIEFHGLHYLTDGDRFMGAGLGSIGWMDLGNIGSANAAGQNVFWVTFGFRWQPLDQLSIGAGMSLPLEDSDQSDILESRFILDAILRL